MSYKLALSTSLVAALLLSSALEAAAGQTKFVMTGVISAIDFADIFEGEIQVGMPFTSELVWDNGLADSNPDPKFGVYQVEPTLELIQLTMNVGGAEIFLDPDALNNVSVNINPSTTIFTVFGYQPLDSWLPVIGELKAVSLQIWMTSTSTAVFDTDALPTELNLTDFDLTRELQLAVVRGVAQSFVHGEIETITLVPIETPVTDCSDGIDNDGDGFIDFPDDEHCNDLEDLSEEPDCSDGIDNDGDGFIDFPDDPGCIALWGARENPQCDDGYSNDGDGLIDFPADPGCRARWWPVENPECDDGFENDTDGKIDFPADPGCRGRWSIVENPQCDDGVNNDPLQDSLTDLDDPDCQASWDQNEACGLGFELLVLLPPMIWLRGRRGRVRA